LGCHLVLDARLDSAAAFVSSIQSGGPGVPGPPTRLRDQRLRGHQPFEELLELELDELFELELDELFELELDELFELELDELLPANCSNLSSVA
jgi:hypothetical protein